MTRAPDHNTGDLFLSPRPRLSAPAARAGAKRGIDQAAESSRRWREEIGIPTLERVARSRAELVADDVWAALPEDSAPRDMRALGPVMQRGARLGWIKRTDRVRPSTLAECHRHLRPVWRSLICEGG